MMLFHTENNFSFVVYLLMIVILSSANALPFEYQHSTPSTPVSSEYKRLASHCYIDDYPAWVERQQELLVWLNLAQLLKLPIHDSEMIQQELEQFRLQHECLRVIERIPVSVGPG